MKYLITLILISVFLSCCYGGFESYGEAMTYKERSPSDNQTLPSTEQDPPAEPVPASEPVLIGPNTNYFLNLNYDSEDSSLIYREPSNDEKYDYKVGDFFWSADQGYNSSGAWRFDFNGWSGEDDTGWNSQPNRLFNFGETNHVFVSYMVKFSPTFLKKIYSNELQVKWQSGVFAWNSDGTDRDSDTRQVSFLRNLPGTSSRDGESYSGGVGWVLVDGGAGYEWGKTINEIEPQFRDQPFDARAFSDQWVYVVFEYDYVSDSTSLHLITEKGEYDSPQGSTPYLHRTQWGQYAPHSYGDFVHTTGIFASYWKTQNYNYASNTYFIIDNLTVTDRWVPAPF